MMKDTICLTREKEMARASFLVGVLSSRDNGTGEGIIYTVVEAAKGLPRIAWPGRDTQLQEYLYSTLRHEWTQITVTRHASGVLL
jgi:hypothetical protein